MQGPVLQPFAYDEAHPYASGQHRGVDLGGDSGETVVAPAAGTVSFAGTVPTNGKSVTIETADGYSVTLTHLGSIGVVKGAAVAEQDAVGTLGPSGTPEVDGPYVHLGIRVTADPNGYVDPLGLLPPDTENGATESDSTVSQPSSSSAAPASKPAPAAPRKWRVATSRGSRPAARSHVSTHPQERVQEPRSKARTSRSSHRAAVRDRGSEPTGSSRRPVVEPVAPRPIGLDGGHELRPPVSLTQPRRKPSSPVPELACNGAAAAFALALMLAASRRRRRRRPSACSTTGAEVLQLPQPAVAHSRVSRAA